MSVLRLTRWIIGLVILAGVLFATFSAVRAADVSNALLRASVTITESTGVAQTAVVVPIPLGTSGLQEAGLLSATTLNSQLCGTIACATADEVPFQPSPTRTRIQGLVADDGATVGSGCGGCTTDTTDANDADANDVTLLPAVPATNDAVYFGGDHPFRILWLNIGTAGAGTWTITWEYWNGSAWTALSGVVDTSSGFTTAATSTVIWTMPTNWATTKATDLPATTYWVRARVSAYTSITTQPIGTRVWYEPGVWWTFTEALGASEARSRYLYLGGPAIRTSQAWFPGSDGATTTYAGALEPGASAFALEWSGYLNTVSGSNKYLLEKAGDLRLAVSGTSELTATVWSTSVTTDTLRPDGDLVAGMSTAPCNPSHYTCVDEAVADDATTTLATVVVWGTTQREQYTLTAGSVPATAVVDAVRIGVRANDATAAWEYITPRLVLSSATTTASTLTFGDGVYVTQETAALARPGGGVWAVADLANLQVVIDVGSSDGNQVYVTQVYVEVDYRPVAATLVATSITSDDRLVRLDSTAGLLRLLVDGTIKATTTAVTIHDAGANWRWALNSSLGYVNYISTTIASTGTLLYQPVTSHDAITLTDTAGTAQNATPSYPAIPTTATGAIGTLVATNAPGTTGAGGTSGVAVSVVTTSADYATTTLGTGLPGGAFFTQVATSSNIPVAAFFTFIGMGLAVVIIGATYVWTKNLLFACLAGGLWLTLLVSPNVGILPVWALLIYAVSGAVVVLLSNRTGFEV